MTNREFQDKALALMRDLFSDKLVLGNTCAKGIRHGREFPSIPINPDECILWLLKKRMEKQRSVVHKPDIGILEYDSIDRFWLEGQCYGERTPDEWKSLFRELIEGRKLLNKKGQHYNISIFDENIPSDVEEKWRKNKENTSDCALILKSQRGFFGVADAKNYSSSRLSKAEIEKTYLDAALLGSKNMYIVCKSGSKKNDFELLEVEKNDQDGNNIMVIRYKKYESPKLISDREGCRTTIKNYLKRKKTPTDSQADSKQVCAGSGTVDAV